MLSRFTDVDVSDHVWGFLDHEDVMSLQLVDRDHRGKTTPHVCKINDCPGYGQISFGNRPGCRAFCLKRFRQWMSEIVRFFMFSYRARKFVHESDPSHAQLLSTLEIDMGDQKVCRLLTFINDLDGVSSHTISTPDHDAINHPAPVPMRYKHFPIFWRLRGDILEEQVSHNGTTSDEWSGYMDDVLRRVQAHLTGPASFRISVENFPFSPDERKYMEAMGVSCYELDEDDSYDHPTDLLADPSDDPQESNMFIFSYLPDTPAGQEEKGFTPMTEDNPRIFPEFHDAGGLDPAALNELEEDLLLTDQEDDDEEEKNEEPSSKRRRRF